MRWLMLPLLLALTACSGNRPTTTGNTLAGVVLINGSTPMPKGIVYVYNQSSTQPIGRGRIDKEGRYRIVNLPTGPVQLLVSSSATMRSLSVDGIPGAVQVGGPGHRPPPPPPPGVDPASMPPLRGETPVSANLQKLLLACDLKYGSLAGEGKVSFPIAPGENTYNIHLDVTP